VCQKLYAYIGNITPIKKIHKISWIFPDFRIQNQIDHITINRKWRSPLAAVRYKRSADVNSDHYFMVATL
jgi:endonuclease/exonuclease/phosphatase family metal-dependent hydrolase